MAEPIRITIAGDAEQLSQTLDEAGQEVSRFGEVAKGLAMAAGGAIAMGIGAGILSALEKEAGADVLAAQLGASPAEAKTLGEAAGAIYAKGYGESVAEANEALKHLWQQGLVPADATSKELEDIGGKAMDVATILGDEVGPVSNAVAQMLKTGLAKNADEAFDILVRGAQEGGNKAEDLLDTFNEYGTQFRKFGLDGKTSMGLISQGLQAGARDADIVADAIKEFSIRAIDGSETTADGFKAIGLNADEMRRKIAAGGPSAQQALGLTLDKLRAVKDPADRAAAAVNLFGTQAEDLGDALYAMDVDTAVDSLGKVDGAAAKAGKTMHDNAATRVKAFTRALKSGITDVISSAVIPVVEKLVVALRAMGAVFRAVAGFVSRFRVPLGIIASAITVLLLPAMVAWGVNAIKSAAANVTAWATSSAASTSGAAKQALAHWSVVGGWLKSAGQAIASSARIVAAWVVMGAQALLQAGRMAVAWLIAMGPIALIIAAVIGLALLIWKYWDQIKAWTLAAFDWVWNKIKQVFEFIKMLFMNFTGPGLIIKHWDTIKAATLAAFDWVWQKIKQAFEFVKNVFMNFTGPGLIIKHWDKIKAATGAAFNWVTDKIRGAFDAVTGLFRNLPGRIMAFAGRIGSAARDIGRTIIEKLGQGVSKLTSFGQDIGAAVARGVKSAINGVIDLLNWALPDKLGFGKFSVSIPANPIPKVRAMGGPASGLVTVGERGKEQVMLPAGSTVVPNHAVQPSGGVVVNVQSNADPFAIGREVAWALRTM